MSRGVVCREFCGEAVLTVEGGVGHVVHTLIVEVGESGLAVGAADGGCQVCVAGYTVAGGKRQTVVEPHGRVVEPEGSGFGLEWTESHGVASKKGGIETADCVCIRGMESGVGFAQHIAPDTLAAKFHPGKGLAYAQLARQTAAQPADRREVSVVAAVPRRSHSVAVAEELEAVAVQASVEGCLHPGVLPSPGVEKRAGEGACGLELIGVGGAVEGLASEVLGLSAQLQMPVVAAGVAGGRGCRGGSRCWACSRRSGCMPQLR